MTATTDLAVETTALTKRYGRRLAVDRLRLAVRRGEVYGFLGPNGAGKSTTLRMLLGLVRPTAGTATLLGRPPGVPAGLARVGALIERPAFYPYLSGRDNLVFMARYAGVATATVDRALELVALTGRAADQAKTYSTGMRQRLGVAAALLKDPDLLILDEPTSGMDPHGVTEIRALVRRLGAHGKTVLLASHLLAEVEQACDRVGVLHRGRLVREGTVADLRGKAELLIRAEPVARARELVERACGSGAVSVDGNVLRVAADATSAAVLARALVGADVAVHELRPVERSLEDVFLQLTREGEEG